MLPKVDGQYPLTNAALRLFPWQCATHTLHSSPHPENETTLPSVQRDKDPSSNKNAYSRYGCAVTRLSARRQCVVGEDGVHSGSAGVGRSSAGSAMRWGGQE